MRHPLIRQDKRNRVISRLQLAQSRESCIAGVRAHHAIVLRIMPSQIALNRAQRSWASGPARATGTGSANISVTKSVQAQISDISDMTLTNWSVGDPDVQLTSNICVYSSTGSYKVTATGSGLLNIFTIASGSGDGDPDHQTLSASAGARPLIAS